MAKSTLVKALDNTLMAPHDIMDTEGNNAYGRHGLKNIFMNAVHKPYFKVAALALASTLAVYPNINDALWGAFAFTAMTAILTINDYREELTNKLSGKEYEPESFINTTVSKDDKLSKDVTKKLKSLRNKYIGKSTFVASIVAYSCLTQDFATEGGNLVGLATVGTEITTYLLTQAYYADRIANQDWTLCDTPPDRENKKLPEATPAPVHKLA